MQSSDLLHVVLFLARVSRT